VLFLISNSVIFDEADTIISACLTLLFHMKHKVEGITEVEMHLNLL
jgi:hypothetical protein